MSLAHVVLNQFSPVAPVGFEFSLGAAAEGHFGHSQGILGTQGVVLGLSKGELWVVLDSGEKKSFYLLKIFSSAISFYFP